MRKNIIKAIVLAIPVALLMISGCKKNFLKTSNPNQTTEDQFWKTEADVLSGVASVYSPMRVPLSGYWGAFAGQQDMNGLGDDVLTMPGQEAPTWQIISFTNDATNGDANSIFTQLYKAIYRANLVLDNIAKVPLTADKQTAYIAETKFLRGLCYFTLASNFGDVPLKIASAKTAEDEFVPCSPVSQVWQQVIADLTAAQNGLPASRATADQGRATSGAAIAYLGKTYLYLKQYAQAETTLGLLYKSPYSYGLVPVFSDNFTSQNKFNQEAVFQWVYGPYGSPYNPWGEESSTSGMYNYLPQFLGTPAGGGWFKYLPTNFFVTQFMKEQRPVGSDTKFDKRMYFTLAWKHSDYGEPDVTWYGGNDTFDQLWASARSNISKISPASLFDTITPGRFLINKFTNAWGNTGTGDNYWAATPSSANNVIMRYAEVLLMHAEAAAQNGDLAGAITDINSIRERAGLLDKTTADLPDVTSIMNEISHQKLLEMFFEQNRWQDLKRWYAPGDLKNYFISVNRQGAQYLQPKNYIFPIPASELQTNNKAVQNPLWK